MTFVSVLNFFTRVNLECRRFNGYLCVRAEKNSELSKTSKMKLLEKIVKVFKNTNYFCNNIYLRCSAEINLRRVFVLKIPRNLTYDNSFCKVTGSKTLISMKQDSTGEEI